MYQYIGLAFSMRNKWKDYLDIITNFAKKNPKIKTVIYTGEIISKAL